MENTTTNNTTAMQPSSFGKAYMVESKELDLMPFDGIKVQIAQIEELEGKFGKPCIKIESEPVLTLEDANKTQIRASSLFGLKRLDNGDVVWESKGKLQKFLQKYGKTHYADLVGVQALCCIVNKGGRNYLELR